MDAFLGYSRSLRDRLRRVVAAIAKREYRPRGHLDASRSWNRPRWRVRRGRRREGAASAGRIATDWIHWFGSESGWTASRERDTTPLSICTIFTSSPYLLLTLLFLDYELTANGLWLSSRRSHSLPLPGAFHQERAPAAISPSSTLTDAWETRPPIET